MSCVILRVLQFEPQNRLKIIFILFAIESAMSKELSA